MPLPSLSALVPSARLGVRRWNLVGFFALAFFVACDQKSASTSKDEKGDKSDKSDKSEKGDDDGDESGKDVPTGTKGAKAKKKKGGKGGGGNTDISSLDGKDLVADLGFRPNADGFGFENFVLSDPNEIPLGPKDLAKMCGNKAVCAGGGDADECTLRAGAQAFLDSAGKMLSGGHCEGFSVGSLRLFTQDDDVSKLGADKTFSLERKKKTERYLAYWAVSQASPSVAKATIRTSPNKTLEKLITALKKKSDPYVLGIYKSDGTGGHAIVPYAIEDKGDDKFWVYVYENNSPGTLRHLEFDKGANTWRYDDAQINPSEAASTYEGDAGNPRLELIPQSSRKQMACPFAAGGGGGGGGGGKKPVVDDDEDDKVAEGDDDVMVVGRGGAKMTVQDEEGHSLGLKDGKLVSEIPGGTYVIVRGKLSSNAPPILIVPAKVKFKLSVRGAAGATDDVAIIGHRFAATLTGVQLGASNKDQIEVDGKAKKLVVLGGPAVASNVTLYMDKGVTVQKLELPKATIGVAGKLQLDFLKGGVTQLDDKGASKPVLITATPVTTKTKPKIGGIEGVDAIGAPPSGPKPKIGGADTPPPPPGTPEPIGTGPKPKIGGADTPPPPPTPGTKPTIGGSDPGSKKPVVGGGGTPPAPPPAPPPPQNVPGKKPKIGGG